MSKRKRIEISAALALILTVIISMSGFGAKCENLRKNILRLHIVANSNSGEDQVLKIKVRDELLKNTQDVFYDCKTLNDAVVAAKENTAKINEIAQNAVGNLYNCKTEVKKEYFSTRVYDDFTLPAGEYNSLTVKIGKAAGHNWWCVIFPGICLPSSGENSLTKSVDEDAVKIAYGQSKYAVRFKIIEILEEIKQKFS